MHHEDELSLLQSSLTELRETSLRRFATLIGAGGYLGILWAFWPTTVSPERFLIAWIAPALLAASVVAYFAHRRLLHQASLLLITGTILAFVLVGSVFRISEIAHLLALPVIFAGVLFGQRGIITFAGMVILCDLYLINIGIAPEDLVFPFVMQAMVTLGVLISTRNLYTTLTWALNGYESAFRNQNIARDRKAELEQALKSLDIATHNLHRVNHALENALSEAREARRLKQQFAQMISHELRTPLNLIVGFSETMIQSPEYYGTPLPPLYARDLTIVYRNACHLQSLVNDVLDLARIESSQIGLQVEECSINAIADESVNTARGLVEARGLAFSADVEADLPVVWIDAVRIKQIIFNLLNNAARFTDKGSVTLSVKRCGDDVVFSVTDTGIGIPADQLDHIFEPFRQLGDSLRRRSGGAGLGLTISQQLAQLHGGTIRVDSEVGKGSTFRFILPIASNEASSQSSVLSPAPTQRRSMQDDVALLVTHSPSAAAMVSRYLRTYRVVVASDLDQARITTLQMLPQVIILDTSGGQYSSADYLTLIRQWGDIAVCAIACPLPGEEILRSQLTADSFLIKPILHDDLWDTLRQFGEEITDILIVDDDRDFVRLIERMLDNALKRYRVTSAHSGAEALAMMERDVPDLMLLDLEMPDMDGYAVIEQIQLKPLLKHVRVVVISGQEEWDNSNLLTGQLVVSRTNGLSASEILRWLRSLLEPVSSIAA